MTFTQKDFDEWKRFSRRMEQEFGSNTYTGTDHAVMVVNYSPEFKAMVRPYPQDKHYEFDLKLLSCRNCKKKSLWLCLPDQLDCCCDDCKQKERKPKEVKNDPAASV